MPIVRARREVRTAPIAGVKKGAHATATSEGVGLQHAKAGTGMAIARAGADIANIGVSLYAKQQQKARREQDEVAFLAATNKVDSWFLSRIHDPEKGALTTRGQAALGLSDTIDTEYQALVGEIAQSLGTPEQKVEFAKWQAQRGFGLQVTLSRHEVQEQEAFDTAETNAKIANAQALAVVHAGDLTDDQTKTAMAEGIATIEKRGARLHQGPEAIASQVAAFRSETTAGIISNLLAQNQPVQAKAYFEEAKAAGVLMGEALIKKMGAAVEVGTVRQAAQQATARILSTGGTLAEQREAAKAIADPDVQDEVLKRIEHEDVIRAREEHDTKEQRSRGVYDILDQTRDVTKIPPSTWAEMSGPERSAARSYVERSIASPTGVQTDFSVYYNLRQKAADEQTQAAFADTDLTAYRHQLGNTEYKQLIDLQMSLLKGDTAKAETVLGGVRSDTQIFNDTIVESGLESDSKEAAQLRRTWERNVDAAQRDGKKLSNTEKQEMLDNLWQRVVLKPGGWANIFPGGEPFYETTTRAADLTIGDIPADARAAVAKQLKKEGRTGTPDEIVARYLAAQRRMGNVR